MSLTDDFDQITSNGPPRKKLALQAASADATATRAPDPVLDKLQALVDAARAHSATANKAFDDNNGVASEAAALTFNHEMSPEAQRRFLEVVPQHFDSYDNIKKVAGKAQSAQSALDAYKKNKGR